LLSIFYIVVPDQHLPAADNEILAYYIVTQMPMGIRGLIIAGVFATMMGSTSVALNALATSFTKDFYLPYFRFSRANGSSVRAARAAGRIRYIDGHCCYCSGAYGAEGFETHDYFAGIAEFRVRIQFIVSGIFARDAHKTAWM
jgi:uncharacterized sodium:solute symporter family permease YidK